MGIVRCRDKKNSGMGSEDLMIAIAEVFGVTVEEMLSGSRKHHLVVPIMLYSVIRHRQIAGEKEWALIISKEINRHRTTVYHHLENYDKSCQSHWDEIARLEERLGIKILEKWY